jgi:hypothetical protein
MHRVDVLDPRARAVLLLPRGVGRGELARAVVLRVLPPVPAAEDAGPDDEAEDEARGRFEADDDNDDDDDDDDDDSDDFAAIAAAPPAAPSNSDPPRAAARRWSCLSTARAASNASGVTHRSSRLSCPR